MSQSGPASWYTQDPLCRSWRLHQVSTAGDISNKSRKAKQKKDMWEVPGYFRTQEVDECGYSRGEKWEHGGEGKLG